MLNQDGNIISDKLATPELQQQQQQQRIKPAIPIKPINLPQQKIIQKNNQNKECCVPSSPNCPNVDCCGILLTSATNINISPVSNFKSNLITSTSSSSGGYKKNIIQNERSTTAIPTTSSTNRPKQSISQYQQSSKQIGSNLEQMLAQRLEKENRIKSSNKKNDDLVATTTAPSTLIPSNKVSTIQKHIQQKLQEEMKQQIKTIQDKHLIEKRLPQQHYKIVVDDDDMVNLVSPSLFVDMI